MLLKQLLRRTTKKHSYTFHFLNPSFVSEDLNVFASSSWCVDQELCIELRNFLNEKFSHTQTKINDFLKCAENYGDKKFSD